MRSKATLLLLVSLLVIPALQGCSSDPPKEGVPIQKDDYTHGPGGGGPAGAPAGNPNKPATGGGS